MKRTLVQGDPWPSVKMVLGLFVILLLGLSLRMHELTSVSFSFDEACSWKISQRPWAEMLDAIRRDAHPPGYYFCLKSTSSVLADSVLVLRGLSLLCGLISIVLASLLVYRCSCLLKANGTKASHEKTALVAALLVAISGLQVEISQQARPYTVVTTLSLMAALLTLNVLQHHRLRSWLGLNLILVALCYTHYYCLFTVAAMLCTICVVLGVRIIRGGWNSDVRSGTIRLALSVWVLQLASLPWLNSFQFQRLRSTRQLWMSELTFETFTRGCWRALTVGHDGHPSEIPYIFGLLLYVGASCMLLLKKNYAATLIAFNALIPLLGVILYSLIVRNILGVKYLAGSEIFVLLSWALMSMQWKQPHMRVLTAMVIFLVTFWGSYQQYELRNQQARYAGTRQACLHLKNLVPQEGVILVGSPFVHPIVQKYVGENFRVYTLYAGDHRSNILSGPALREDDYRHVNQSIASEERVWTVDVFGLFYSKSHYEFSPGQDWILVSQEEFREDFGLKCILAVREYQRKNLSAGP